MNHITALRLKRAKSKRSPMPVSQKPRRKTRAELFIDYAGAAGRLVLSFIASTTLPPEEKYRRRLVAHMKRTAVPKRTGTREAARRVRQGVFHHQHESVVRRFAKHPLQADIAKAIAEVEAVPAKPKRSRVRKIVEAFA